MTPREKGLGMLDIVRDVRDSSTSITGSPWIVYDELAALADRGDVDAMVTYFQAYKRSARGIRLRQRLEAFGRKTLESQERRFLAIARSA